MTRHVEVTGCGLSREDFDDDTTRCVDGGLPSEHPYRDDEPGTYVVYGESTGWSEESMRFGSKREAEAWIKEHELDEIAETYGMRYEP